MTVWQPVAAHDPGMLEKGGLSVRIGALTVRMRVRVPEAASAFRFLYGDFPATPEIVPVDFHLDVAASTPWRRYLRRDAKAFTDMTSPSAPLAAAHGALALEMGLNLQSAWATNRFLALHGAVLAAGDRGVILTAGSGGGKSTLSAGLSCLGWRFLSDEFCLLDPATARLVPNPRPASLKAASIEALMGLGAGDRLLTPLEGTFKGRISWLKPDMTAIANMHQTATPALIVLPSYIAGSETTIAPVGKNEAFIKLAEGAANYETFGEAGFDLMSDVVSRARAIRLSYSDLRDASIRLRAELGGGV